MIGRPGLQFPGCLPGAQILRGLPLQTGFRGGERRQPQFEITAACTHRGAFLMQDEINQSNDICDIDRLIGECVARPTAFVNHTRTALQNYIDDVKDIAQIQQAVEIGIAAMRYPFAQHNAVVASIAIGRVRTRAE